MKLGIGSYAFAWNIGVPGLIPEHPMDVFEFVKTASNLGAEVVQIADNLPLHGMEDRKIQQLIKVCSRLGLSAEIGTRGLQVDRVKQYLKIAQRFDSPFLRLVVDDVGFEPSLDQIIRDVRLLLPVMQQRGVMLAIENHDRFKVKELVQIIEATDPQLVGICLDTANSLGAGEGIEEAMRYLAPFTVNLHVKDFVVDRVPSNMGFTVSGCPAGEGVIDVPSLLRRLSKNQNFFSVTLELWSDLMSDIEQTTAREHRWAAKSMTYLKSLVGSLQKVT